MEKGYIGRISNAGTQIVKAPNQVKAPAGKTVAKKGSDLRTGKK